MRSIRRLILVFVEVSTLELGYTVRLFRDSPSLSISADSGLSIGFSSYR
jgi:hypothetical protein